MGIQAECHVVWVRADEHMVKLTRRLTQFGVMIVIGERLSAGTKLSTELVQRFCLPLQLVVSFVFRSSPAQRTRDS